LTLWGIIYELTKKTIALVIINLHSVD
jgi:hypothetical protein